MVSCHTADSKPVKQEVNCTVILPPLVFPAIRLSTRVGSGLCNEYKNSLKNVSVTNILAYTPTPVSGEDKTLIKFPPYVNVLKLFLCH